MAWLAFLSLASSVAYGIETGGASECGLLSTAATVNAVLNLMTIALIAYVTKITHRLDKEVLNGGE